MVGVSAYTTCVIRVVALLLLLACAAQGAADAVWCPDGCQEGPASQTTATHQTSTPGRAFLQKSSLTRCDALNLAHGWTVVAHDRQGTDGAREKLATQISCPSLAVP